MAKVVKAMPSRNSGGGQGAPQKYPWEKWLDGRVWKLTKGEDFDSDPKMFRTYVWKVATSKYGCKVETRIVWDDLYVQAYTKEY